MEIPDVWDELLLKRQRAINREKLRENFLTKHCNIIYQGAGTETYIPIDQVKACKVQRIDWEDREVYVGVDLAMTNDNCSVTMSAEEDGEILSHVMTFIPEEGLMKRVSLRSLITGQPLPREPALPAVI